MRLQSLALLAGASLVAADSTTTLFLPGFDVQSIDGKILGSSGSMTTYLLNCPPGEDSNKCGLPPNGYTITEGASSIIMAVHYNAETITQSCKLTGTVYANCVATVTLDGSTSVESAGYSIATIPYGGFMPVHITATETAGAEVSTGISASSTTTTSARDTTLVGTVTSTSSTSTSTATAKTSDSTNAAMPVVTGNARWVVGGAAVLAMAVV